MVGKECLVVQERWRLSNRLVMLEHTHTETPSLATHTRKLSLKVRYVPTVMLSGYKKAYFKARRVEMSPPVVPVCCY